MIKRVNLRHFKCFDDNRFDMGNLTLLSGVNGTGKSSLIQSLLLLRQAMISESFEKKELPINGNLVKLGTAKDILFSGSDEDSIDISLHMVENDKEDILKWEFQKKNDRSDAYYLKATKIPKNIPREGLFGNNFTYLTAERLGPRIIHSLSDLPKENMHMGISGEYMPHFLAQYGQDRIPNKKLGLENENGEMFYQLENQVQLWMRKFIPGFSYTTHEIVGSDCVQLVMKVFSGNVDYMRPTNIGFGVSYTMPIIVASLMAEISGILIVENPEAHLHPAGQSEIAKLLAKVASSGVQVIVETHSDHILNGIRIAVKTKMINHDEVEILHFKRGKNLGSHSVDKLKIYEDGGIDKWPEGFFDQLEKDLNQML